MTPAAEFYFAALSLLPRKRHLFLRSDAPAYSSVARCRILRNGSLVLFAFENGVYYVVDTRYLRSWFPFPEKIRERGRWRAFHEGRLVDAWVPTDTIRVARSRRVYEPVLSSATRKVWGEVLLYLSNGEAVEVHEDRILAACEPTWEFFDAFAFGGRTTRRDALAVLEKYGYDGTESLFVAARSMGAVIDAGWNTIARVQMCDSGESIRFDLKGGDTFLLSARLVYGWASPGTSIQAKSGNGKTRLLRVTACSICHHRTAVRMAFSNGESRMIHVDVLIAKGDYRSQNVTKAQLLMRGK